MLLSVSSFICCMFVSCVHPVAVLNAAFCCQQSHRTQHPEPLSNDRPPEISDEELS